MDNKLKKLEIINRPLKPLGGLFLPTGSQKQFEFMFVAEMPSMNEPNEMKEGKSFNFGVTAEDKFLQKLMIKNNVAGSYVTDIVKRRDRPRRPTRDEINQWLPVLIEEIEIIQPKYIIVLGKTNYDVNFRKFVEPLIPKDIKIDWVWHYSQQGSKTNVEVEQRFSEIIDKMRNNSRP
jgi:uracil-DNA glycosylase family 4